MIKHVTQTQYTVRDLLRILSMDAPLDAPVTLTDPADIERSISLQGIAVVEGELLDVGDKYETVVVLGSQMFADFLTMLEDIDVQGPTPTDLT